MNQNPEQLARDKIDAERIQCGWVIQDKSKINLNAGLRVAIREYQTDIGPADYVLFIDKKPINIIKAKWAEEDVLNTVHEVHPGGYRKAKLKYLNYRPLFVILKNAIGLTCFTDYFNLDPKRRSIFTFRYRETFTESLKQILPACYVGEYLGIRLNNIFVLAEKW